MVLGIPGLLDMVHMVQLCDIAKNIFRHTSVINAAVLLKKENQICHPLLSQLSFNEWMRF